jgi:phosphatidylglycerol lysyltransferase
LQISTTPAVIATQTHTYPVLVYLRDKALLFNDSRSAFVMYRVQGRTWVALGDPVGPPGHFPQSCGNSSSAATISARVPVFYEVGSAHLHLYADFGLTFVKPSERKPKLT